MLKNISYKDTKIRKCHTIFECLNIKRVAILRVDKDLEQLNSHDLLLKMLKIYI